ncbi:MAG: hypothetical protein WC761_01405 [Candidatus Paceibacterota bacterium]|jgi:hypothetical protein
MGTINFKSAGVSARTINLSGPTGVTPTGIPAGVIGTSQKGPAFVPTTLATMQDFVVKFGPPTTEAPNGPLAMSEWLRNAQAATFIRVLGVGSGLRRTQDGDNRGKVTNAGFVVGSQLPQEALAGNLGSNTYAVTGGIPGRTYFLGSFMSQSSNSTVFTDAGLSGSGVPLVRGIIFAASGVLLTLSSSTVASVPNAANAANWTNAAGAITGSVNLNSSRQEFVMILNGHKNNDASNPNVITASFDVDAPNYFGQLFNKDPYKIEQSGYFLQSEWAIHPSLAVVTGAGVVNTGSNASGYERIAFLITGSQARNSGSSTAPNFENFEDRYRTAKSPWVTTQKFGGSPQNLFRVHALDDGAWANDNIKISIENITPSLSDANLYGKFDLLVRDFNDNDKNRVVLEAFRGLSLDPDNQNFVARVIGDYNTFYNLDTTQGNAKLITEGSYPNNSKYIRVELDSRVSAKETDSTALPMGFRGVPHLVTSGSAPFAAFTDLAVSGGFQAANPFYRTVQMPVPMRQNITRGTDPNKTVDKGLYWGVQFERKTSALEPNKSTIPEASINSFSSYFPDFQVDWKNMVVSNNEGALDTTTNGIMDADRFNNNLFSLENIQVVYNSTTLLPDTTLITSWSYQRAGGITTSVANLTRALQSSDLADPSARQLAKFSFALQGGFDGVRVFNRNENNLTNEATVEEVDNLARGGSTGPTITSYNTALDLISDATEVDIQMMALPGIRTNVLTDRALLVAENRFDALYLMDIENYDTNNALVTGSSQTTSVRYTTTNFRDRGLNTSFGAAYFPDVIMRDTINDTTRNVPASVAVLGAFSHNDRIAYPWFAPAGFARGALDTTNSTALELSRENMDDLYEVNINPIVSFAGSSGPVVWGQKTLYATQSALDRVNVRRLLLSIRRQVKRVSNRIIFEQGLPETLARFSQLVNPILKRIQDQRGVDRFLVQIDTSTTTTADFENKTIRGKIFVVPTKTLEFLSIDFVINNANNFGQG